MCLYAYAFHTPPIFHYTLVIWFSLFRITFCSYLIVLTIVVCVFVFAIHTYVCTCLVAVAVAVHLLLGDSPIDIVAFCISFGNVVKPIKIEHDV